MRKNLILFILLILSVLFVGCAEIKHGNTTYRRFGNQELGDVYFTTDPNGTTHVEIKNQKSNMIDLLKLFYNAGLEAK